MPAPARAKAKQAKRILVVDDDRTTRRLIVGLLKKSGYAVSEAGNGAEALAQFKSKPYDLVLLDVWMPEMTGPELLARLRSEGHSPRAIVMTSDETPETILKVVREQAFQYVHKPVEPDKLHELVTRALAAPAIPPIEVLSAKPHWVELLVPCDRGTVERIQSFLQGLKADLPEKLRDTLGLAFHELLCNAIEWGGRLDPEKKVRISYVRTPRLLLYRIADPGKGFKFEELEHSALKNPEEDPFRHVQLREEKALLPGGFGLLMTKTMVDELVYNEAQNEVLFVKYLTPAD